MVVVFHAHIYVLPQKIELGASYFLPFNMGYAGVELFFVISGFIMWLIHAKDVGVLSKTKPFIYKRFTRIYPVYWLILSGLIVLYFIFPESGPDNARNLKHALLSATLLPLPFDAILEIAWTLQHEMLFYFFFTLLICHRTWGGIAFLFWGLGCVINLFINTEMFPLLFIFSAYNLLFFFGIVAAQFLQKQSPASCLKLAILGLMLFLCVGVAEAYGFVEWYKPLRTILYGLGAAMVLSVTKITGLNTNRFKPLILIGDASYSLYLIHMPFMLICYKVLEKLSLHNILPAPLMFVGLIAAAIAFSVGFYWFVERRLITLFRTK